MFDMYSKEWQIIDIALQSYNKVSVSLYDTLGKDSVGKYCLLSQETLVNVLFLSEYM